MIILKRAKNTARVDFRSRSAFAEPNLSSRRYYPIRTRSTFGSEKFWERGEKFRYNPFPGLYCSTEATRSYMPLGFIGIFVAILALATIYAIALKDEAAQLKARAVRPFGWCFRRL
jgi:hypothetical protein